MKENGRRIALVVFALTGFGAVIALLAMLLAPAVPKNGPVPIVWDREVCTHCRMHIGLPGFAAQIQTRSGEILNFDDPGCLFEYVEHEQPNVAKMYFHHHSQDRWLDESQAHFIHQRPSPMGYGLAAADANESGSIGLAEARAEIGNGRAQAEAGGSP